MELNYNENWQTQTRGTNDSEYQMYLVLAVACEREYETYLSCAGDSDGNDFTGQPLKTYDEWLNS
mgnify:CR=1 FL=1